MSLVLNFSLSLLDQQSSKQPQVRIRIPTPFFLNRHYFHFLMVSELFGNNLSYDNGYCGLFKTREGVPIDYALMEPSKILDYLNNKRPHEVARIVSHFQAVAAEQLETVVSGNIQIFQELALSQLKEIKAEPSVEQIRSSLENSVRFADAVLSTLRFSDQLNTLRSSDQ